MQHVLRFLGFYSDLIREVYVFESGIGPAALPPLGCPRCLIVNPRLCERKLAVFIGPRDICISSTHAARTRD